MGFSNREVVSEHFYIPERLSGKEVGTNKKRLERQGKKEKGIQGRNVFVVRSLWKNWRKYHGPVKIAPREGDHHYLGGDRVHWLWVHKIHLWREKVQEDLSGD